MYFSNITPGYTPQLKPYAITKYLQLIIKYTPLYRRKAKMRNIQNIIKTLSNPVDISGSQVHANF